VRRHEREEANIGSHVHKYLPRAHKGIDELSFCGLKIYAVDQATQLAIQMKLDLDAGLKTEDKASRLPGVRFPPRFPRALTHQFPTVWIADKLNGAPDRMPGQVGNCSGQRHFSLPST
jgi:hypothetical protein